MVVIFLMVVIIWYYFTVSFVQYPIPRPFFQRPTVCQW